MPIPARAAAVGHFIWQHGQCYLKYPRSDFWPEDEVPMAYKLPGFTVSLFLNQDKLGNVRMHVCVSNLDPRWHG